MLPDRWRPPELPPWSQKVVSEPQGFHKYVRIRISVTGLGEPIRRSAHIRDTQMRDPINIDLCSGLWKMIPTVKSAALLAAGGLLIGLSSICGALLFAGVVVISFAIVGMLADWLRMAGCDRVEVFRNCDEKLSLGIGNQIRIRLRNPTYIRLAGAVRDEYPDGITATGNVISFRIAPRSEIDLAYTLTPNKRGNYKFGDIYLRFCGPLGLAMRQIRHIVSNSVQVYPNILDTRRYEIALKKNRAVQPGQRITRMYGRGMEFESLREYLPDDEFKSIDWKASARLGKLAVRQYQQERAQNVVLMLDCGRVMGPVIDGLTRLDHSINAAMMLAHVATQNGDKAGLIAFSDDILAYSPPKAGKSQVLSLLKMTYNLKEAMGESNYYRAFPYLAKRWTRRSLIVVFTDLSDPESSRPLISQIASLTHKHVCICVAMNDPAVLNAANNSSYEAQDAFRTAAARQVLAARKSAAAQLVRSGVIVLDIPPSKLTPTVINEYLNLKSKARL